MKACANACGDCRRCRAITARLRETARNARLLKRAMQLLEACRWDLGLELASNDPKDVRQNPFLRTKIGLVARIENLARQVEAK